MGEIYREEGISKGGVIPGVQLNLPSPRAIAIVFCENRTGLWDRSEPSAPGPAGAIGRGTKEGCRKEMLHNLLKAPSQQMKCF